MQLQIEFNSLSLERQQCCICKQQFEMKEARVIVCSEKNEGYGEVCSHCIGKGFTWIENQFQNLSYQRNLSVSGIDIK